MNQDGLAYLQGKLWILNSKKSRLMGVNAESGEVTHDSIEVAEGVTRIVAAAGSLWIIDTQASEVSRFDPDTSRIVARIPVGDSPTDAVLFEDAIWVVNARERSLTRIELESNATITRPVPTAALPVQIFEGDGSLWLTTLDMFRVIRIQEPASEVRLAAGQVGAAPTLQCLTGPEYHKEMLERECESARAIQGGPAGKLAAMVSAGDGGWAFAGTTSDPDPALLLIRTNQRGKILWEQRFGHGAETRAVDVVRLDDESLAVAGDIRTDKESPWESVVARVDANSNLIWEKRYAAEGAARLVSQIAALPSGGLAMAGSLLSSSSSSQRHGFVDRIDADGEMAWETELKEIEGVDRFAPSGTEFAVMGPPQGQASPQFLRVGFTGNLIGSVKAASENMQATDLVAIAEGGWAVVGDPGEWAGKGHLLRLDPQGEVLWCRYLGSANAYKWVWKLLPLGDGSLLAAATPRHSQSFSGSKGFLNLTRISAEGELLGEQLFKGFADRQVVGLFPWSDGFVVFTAGDWRGPLGQKLVRAYERPKRRYSGSLKAATRILLDPKGRVREEGP